MNKLINRLLDPANPFPARVAVNRIWHHLMGRGLVETVDDFGVMFQGAENAQHLIDALQQKYKVTVDWSGSLYCGLTFLPE